MENLPAIGCVYFFKHKGMSPIKIGYTSGESCLHRFDAFRTYAPYGAEIIGFIECFDPPALEKKLHEELKHCRLKGEFFDISVEDARQIINREMSECQKDEMTFFMQKYLLEKTNKIRETKKSVLIKHIPTQIEVFWRENPNFNRSKAAKKLKVSRVYVQQVVKKLSEL